MSKNTRKRKRKTPGNLLIPGDWREGVEWVDLQSVNTALDRKDQGFSQFPYESTTVILAKMLDDYDDEYTLLQSEMGERDDTIQYLRSRIQELEEHEAVEPELAESMPEGDGV